MIISIHTYAHTGGRAHAVQPEKMSSTRLKDVYIVISKYVIIQDYLDNKLITIMTLEMHRFVV